LFSEIELFSMMKNEYFFNWKNQFWKTLHSFGGCLFQET